MTTTATSSGSPWNAVRQAFNMNESTASLGRRRWSEVQEILQLGEVVDSPVDEVQEKSSDTPCSTKDAMQTTMPGSPVNAEKHLSEGPTLAKNGDSEWGTVEEIHELNESVKDCLRIEGLAPEDFFTKDATEFPSVTSYYMDLHELMSPHEIDLFVSLWFKLGATHPLVHSLRMILDDENHTGVAYDPELLVEGEMVQEEDKRVICGQARLIRESTLILEEKTSVAQNVLVPGIAKFSEESRALSWVVRTGPPLHQQISDIPAVLVKPRLAPDATLSPISHSEDDKSIRDSQQLGSYCAHSPMTSTHPLSTIQPPSVPTISGEALQSESQPTQLPPRPSSAGLCGFVRRIFCFNP